MKKLLALALVLLSFAACSDSPSPDAALLVGKWSANDGNIKQMYVFEKDGGIEYALTSPYISTEYKGKYTVKGDVIHIVDSDDISYTEKFKFSNESLILIRDKGEVTFIREE